MIFSVKEIKIERDIQDKERATLKHKLNYSFKKELEGEKREKMGDDRKTERLNKFSKERMVLILDGNSEHAAHRSLLKEKSNQICNCSRFLNTQSR